MPSLNNTVVGANAIANLPGPSIIDAVGNAWAIANGQVTINGIADPTTANVDELAYENGSVWQENANGLWWSKTSPSDAWNPPNGTSIRPDTYPQANSGDNTVISTPNYNHRRRRQHLVGGQRPGRRKRCC